MREVGHLLVENAHARPGEAPQLASPEATAQVGGAVAPTSAEVRPA
jgi:hypothetical protein